MSQILEKVSKRFGLEEELEILEPFYADAKREIENIGTDRTARQNFIKKIYSNFFASASKKETEQYGIVYTPVEIIDFIINSVQELLKDNFDTEFNHRDVKVLEPFAGTGTFVSRLLESGYITDNLYTKYKRDIFANEMILLAYYIATVNIETTYASLKKGSKYLNFEGINYTDTIKHNARYREHERHRHENTKLNEDFASVHERTQRQKKSHVHVLIGNPPYSAGQDNYNKNAQNKKYPELDDRIRDTYVKKTKAHNVNSLYDSYIRSLRWASDRIGNSGIIAFITNASFIKSDVSAGVRASLKEEFTDVWCFDLRGNARTNGEIRRKEGGNVFDIGSRAPVAITILVKNPKKEGCTIHYKDIGDYHTREKKLETINNVKSIQGIKDWQIIKPDKHHDWIDQRTDEFSKYGPIGSKDAKAGKANAVFKIYSRGIATSRDAWVYNSSKDKLEKNMKKHIDYCNNQDFNNPVFDPKQAKWTPGLSDRLKRSPIQRFEDMKIRTTLYRPFFKQYLYFDSLYNEGTYLIPKIFSTKNSENLVISIPYKFTGKFSVFVTDITPDIQLTQNGQCFPLYTYQNNKKNENITDDTLDEYQKHYKSNKITKKDIFYYVYGMLHHNKYRKKFANNLTRELPHIPMAPSFEKFCNAGKELATTHLSYETCKKYSLKPKAKFGNLEKMAYPRIKKDGKNIADKTRLKINGIEIFDNIPLTNYTVNGRTPLDWLIDRYKFTIDKDSGITNNPNKDMTEQKTIEMIERILYVSIESDKIITELSNEEFEPKNWEPKKSGLDEFTDGTAPTQSRL